MIVFLFLLARHSLSEEQKPTETEANIEEDKSLLETQVLSDFITARLSRNLTVKGQHELEPIVGKYLRKPLVNLLQGISPSNLNLRRLYFTNFDNIILKGESNCLARFPDITISDCTFKGFRMHPIHINGPSGMQEFEDQPEQNQIVKE